MYGLHLWLNLNFAWLKYVAVVVLYHKQSSDCKKIYVKLLTYRIIFNLCELIEKYNALFGCYQILVLLYI